MIPAATLSEGRWWGHPRGLYILCLVEMWERFSYYGMRALLLLYLVDHLKFGDARATLLYGAYTAMVYGFCVLGGWIADRFVGQWRSITLGACLILAGHLGLAFQDLAGLSPAAARHILFVSLALIVSGTGLFKPSSTTLVSRLYPEGGARRIAGFHLFYFGINFGGAISALICGALAARFGWGVGLGAAAAGMSLGLVVLGLGRDTLRPAALPAPRASVATIGAPLAMIVVAAGLILRPTAVAILLCLTLGVALAIIARFCLREASIVERKHIGVILALTAAAAIFWSLSEQAGSALSLFADRLVDLRAGPIALSAPQTQSFSPAFILLLTPALAALWVRLRSSGREPGVAWKHVAGLTLAGAGFAALGAGIALSVPGTRVPLGWLILSYLLQTTGEICLAPTAYNAVARLAPDRIAALLMGLWLFSIAIGNFVGATVATLVARPIGGIGVVAEAAQYQAVFLNVAFVAGIAAMLLALAAPRLERWTTP